MKKNNKSLLGFIIIIFFVSLVAISFSGKIKLSAIFSSASSLQPIGSLDLVDGTSIAGWAKDDDYAGPIMIHIYIDGQLTQRVLANKNRSDVGAHAFHWVHEAFGAGDHRVQVFAIGVDSKNVPDGQNPEISNSPKAFNIGCRGLVDNEYGWCGVVPSYWQNRQKDTVILSNEAVRVGIDKSFGGAITQLYGSDWTNNLIEEHGGSAMQVSLWGYDPKGGVGWFANEKAGCDAIPYKTEALCKSSHSSCVAREYSAGEHVASCTAIRRCNDWDPGAPWNPTQAQGTYCSWDNSSNDVSYSSGNKNQWTIRRNNVAHFTKNGPAFSGMTFMQKVSLGDAYAKIDYTLSYNGSYTLSSHPQEIPAIFTPSGIDARMYYYSGNDPYKNLPATSTTALGEVFGKQKFLAMAGRSPYPHGNPETIASEPWWTICDQSEARCLTVASFSNDVKEAGMSRSIGKSGYVSAIGLFNLFPGFQKNITLYVFPYKYDKVVGGKSIRQRIYDLKP